MKSRRIFLKKITAGAGSVLCGASILSFTSCQDKGVAYENDKTPALAEDQKLGVALVGLGGYSEGQLGPALKETKYCKLSGIVTGTPEKVERWKKEYKLQDKNVYSYDTFDNIKDNKEIDIVYVVLPNAMHAEYVIRAAKAGKHVICEKPMAVTAKECEEMIQACKDAGVLLSIGYRLHFEPFNLEMMRLGQEKVFGQIRKITSANGFKMNNESWRVKKALSGGGPLMDMGIYCLQGVVYTLGQLPVAVTAKEGEKTEKERFREVEQSISWTMEFANGTIAECFTSYDDELSNLRAEADKGWFELSPAFGYSGKKGSTSNGKIDFPEVFEQVYQMDDFAKCILEKKQTKVPGEMGLRDVKIINAIYEAAATGKRIELSL